MSIDEVSAYPPAYVPKHIRFVTCKTCDDDPECGTVMQRRDSAGVFRPEPPMCGDCLERLAEQTEAWYAQREAA